MSEETMKNNRRELIRTIFAEAYKKKTYQERSLYLNKVCGTDSELRSELESLLKAHDKYGDFLEGSPIIAEVRLDDSPISEIPGTLIDRYKLLEKIGEGGMAIVYMAEQQEPIQRKVALKIIKLGMDTKSVIARFEAERQALAMMNHPNIAKVLDAGATETGRPYFVMELVTGVTITEYCDTNNLSTKERLALFIEVCNAVQHAHQKGIIHRDIKPTNVMVEHHDGEPVPKVIDFGIAKATNQRLTEKTLFTRYAHIIGTPAYMSPEQAELSALGVDTRSDIYSLGVLLYELLTGTTPFSEEELRKAGYLEMQRIIREQEPAKPSTKLSTLGETLTNIAKRRGCTPDLLTKTVRGDLDWIVMKTLEKVRDRRYDTVSALVMDIQQNLNDEPVLARAPSTIYQLRKFLRRHRSHAIASIVVSILVVALFVVLLIWNNNQRQLEMEVAVRHRTVLYRAKNSLGLEDFAAASTDIKSILTSKHVGSEARRVYDEILADVHKHMVHYTQEIEAHPEDANNYFQRAKCFDCLDDREKANADMEKRAALLSQQWRSDYEFGAPENLGSSVNSSLSESFPKISSDGLNLYYIRSVGDYTQGEKWMASRAATEDPWGIAVKLGSLTEGFSPPIASFRAVPGLTPNNGLEICFWASAPNEPGNYDIWLMTRESIDAPWDTPENLGPPVNSPSDEFMACISPDGLELYFSDLGVPPRPGGYGGGDIWVTRRASREDPWSEPVSLAPPVNSPSQDSRPCISPDGLMLFFDSYRPGGYGLGDLYVTRRTNLYESWGEPVNLGPLVNSEAHDVSAQMSPDGSVFYYCSTRPGGYGRHDLWKVAIIAPGNSPHPTGRRDASRELTEIDLEEEVVPEENH
jgi:serine/threonine protein kinase